MSDDLIRPHGGRLVNLLVGRERAQVLVDRATHWQSWELSKRQLCDLELLLSGAFSPLQGFLGRSDYESVCASMRLADGTLWPIPVMLDVPESIVGHLGDGSLALRDPEGALLAVLHVQEIWRPDRTAEARMVLGTDDDAHPGAAHLHHETHPCQRDPRGRAAARALRLPPTTSHSGRAQSGSRTQGMAQRCRVPDTK